jgi:amino acid permease
MILNL